MPRPAADTHKTSLYRLNIPSSGDPIQAVQKKYVDSGFHKEFLQIAERPAILIYGTIEKEKPDWATHVLSLTDFLPPVGNKTSAGLLIVGLDDGHDRQYGLSWGMGHLLLDQNYVDTGFGLRFALRRADADQISALTTHALDTLPKTARMSVFGGTSLGSFGLEEVGEVISRLVGRIRTEGLSSHRVPKPAGKRSRRQPSETFVTVRGSDALGIPLAKTPSNLLSDLNFIDQVVEKEKPAEGLEHLENTHPLRPTNPRIKGLNQSLSEALSTDGARLALCWPSEWDDEGGESAKYEIFGFGPTGDGVVDELALQDILSPVRDTPTAKRLSRLKAAKIQSQDQAGLATSRQISCDRWITFETVFEGERYVFHRGRWYNVGGAYLELLRQRIDRIMAKKSDITLPAWPLTKKRRRKTGIEYIDSVVEGVYNDDVVTRNTGYYSLDRKLLRTRQHPRGFEACDILAPDNTLIHVKRLDDSVSASHLFNQAIVSAEALRRQVDAIEEFQEKVHIASSGARVISGDFRVKRVALAFAGGAAETDSLFTFSQVTLSRCAQRLEELEIELAVIEIDSSEELFMP